MCTPSRLHYAVVLKLHNSVLWKHINSWSNKIVLNGENYWQRFQPSKIKLSVFSIISIIILSTHILHEIVFQRKETKKNSFNLYMIFIIINLATKKVTKKPNLLLLALHIALLIWMVQVVHKSLNLQFHWCQHKP